MSNSFVGVDLRQEEWSWRGWMELMLIHARIYADDGEMDKGRKIVGRGEPRRVE